MRGAQSRHPRSLQVERKTERGGEAVDSHCPPHFPAPGARQVPSWKAPAGPVATPGLGSVSLGREEWVSDGLLVTVSVSHSTNILQDRRNRERPRSTPRSAAFRLSLKTAACPVLEALEEDTVDSLGPWALQL